MTKRLSWIGVLTLLGCTANYAAIITTPAGLTPGSKYQLVFVTSGTIDADQGPISIYNTFVTNEAALDPALAAFDTANSVTWTVIGSTTLVNASTNAPSTGSVFTLNGVQVASAANPLYSGSILSPVDIDENGNTISNTIVWTGATSTGGMAGGINDLDQVFPLQGVPTATNSTWLSTAGNVEEGDNPALVYALSSVITVPGTVASPEPGTIALVPVAFLLLFGIKRLRAVSHVPGSY
jgi:hypothetical protein